MVSVAGRATAATQTSAATNPAGDESIAASLGSFAVLLALAGLVWWILIKTDTVRRGSLDRARRTDPPLTSEAALPLFLLAFGVFLAPQFLGGAILAITGSSAESDALSAAAQTAALIYGPAIVVSGIAMALAARAGLVPSGRMRWSMKAVVLGFTAFVLAAPIIWAVGAGVQLGLRLFSEAPGSSIQHGTLDMLTAQDASANPWWWVVLAGAVVGAPIFEEVVFRGFLQPAIAGLSRSRWAGIVVSSAVFTLMHIPSGSENSGATWLAIPTLAVLSISMGVALERTGRLWVPIVMHIAFNAANVGLAFAVSQG